MGKKTNFVKDTFKAIKTKLKTNTSTSDFKKNLQKTLNYWIAPKLKQGFDWLDDKISIEGEIDGKNMIVITITPKELNPNALVKRVVKKAEEQLKSNNEALSKFNFDDPNVTYESTESALKIMISGDYSDENSN